MSTSKGPRSEGRLEMIEELITTLKNEYEALQSLANRFQAQLDVLRQQNLDGLEDETLKASDAVSELDRLTQSRMRQMRLVGRMLEVEGTPDVTAIAEAARPLDDEGTLHKQLLDLRNRIRTQAAATQQLSDELSYALRYTASLGREMIAFLRGATSSAPAQVYTDSGQSPSTERDSLVNKIG